MSDPASIVHALASAEIEAEAKEFKTGEFLVSLHLAIPPRVGPSGLGAAGLGEAIRSALAHYGDLAETLAKSGAEIDVDEFMRIAKEVVRTHGSASVPPSSQFTAEEARRFSDGGFDAPSRLPLEPDPIPQSAAHYSQLLATALSTQSAARLLGVEESRIRQRLLERTLYGVKVGRNWRLPSFQFTKTGLVPGAERVFPRLDPLLHPLAVSRWFLGPHPDLVYEERELSPRDWLLSGADASVLESIAEDL